MKRFLSLILITALCLCAAPAALALDGPVDVDGGAYTVTFGADGKSLTSTYDAATKEGGGTYYDLSEKLTGSMQPGDSAKVTMNIVNNNAASTDWYMTNEVIQSLEETAGVTVAENGGYSYRLSYTGPAGSENSRELYNSSRVGGTNIARASKTGLEQATDALDTLFYLDTLAPGQSGKLVLELALDGESQGNDYQSTLAKLNMQFAVELTPTTTTEHRVRHERTISTSLHYAPVKTGDENRLLLWSLVMLGCGLAALALAVYNHRKDRRDRE